MSETVLVIAAHPDDEILGCGGTMARHVKIGDTVHVAILAEGITSRDDRRAPERREQELSALREAAHRANEIIGVKTLVLRDLPDNRMDTIALLDIVKEVKGLIDRFRPELLYTHHPGDVNIDHRRTHEAVVTACRPMPGNQLVTSLLFFEIASSTEWQPPGSGSPFTPDWFVDVSDTLDQKLEALGAYALELRPWPHARSVAAVEHLAHWRGATIGVNAAEAFELGRKLIL